jgi:hypothetical protein
MTHKDNKTARDESSAVLLNNNNIDIDKRLHEILDNADLYEKDGYGGYEVNKEWLVPQIQALFITTLQQRERAIEKDILELIGEDVPITGLRPPEEEDFFMTRNKLKAELRLKLKEYIGNKEKV